jgi:hypothetical protein
VNGAQYRPVRLPEKALKLENSLKWRKTSIKSLNKRQCLSMKFTSTLHCFLFVQTLAPSMRWEGLHYDPGDNGCPCTCLATQGEDMIVSAGEDGRLNVLNVAHKKPVRTIGNVFWYYSMN